MLLHTHMLAHHTCTSHNEHQTQAYTHAHACKHITQRHRQMHVHTCTLCNEHLTQANTHTDAHIPHRHNHLHAHVCMSHYEYLKHAHTQAHTCKHAHTATHHITLKMQKEWALPSIPCYCEDTSIQGNHISPNPTLFALSKEKTRPTIVLKISFWFRQ